jgi:ASPIC and UnbV/FG-GAP-like repeat/NQR2, RnfD, RnfE family
MSAPALVRPAGPTLRIGDRFYPVLLPRLSDPRLHLASVIVSLQVLGQVAFEFRLSIAQILVSLLTCAVLEFAITFRRQHVIMWPASALLTGNGVAFILRVPGTEHGDWWSMRGWWIFAGTAAVSLLSKHVIRFRGHHIFNPSNFGLVLCFVILGSTRADPLAFWWGPMSPWMVLALTLIVAGGLTILSRIGLLGIAVCFWLAFVAGIAVLAASGHVMTASWHLGPITGWALWRVLVFSPEVMVFMFFMITDPKTTPEGRGARRAYAVAIALLAVLLIAPQTTEFWTKVVLLGSLTIVCAVRPLLGAVRSTSVGAAIGARLPASRPALGAAALVAAAGFAGILVLAGLHARPAVMAVPAVAASVHLPAVTVASSQGVASRIDPAAARQIARDVVADLRIEGDALRRRQTARASESSDGPRLADIWRRIRVPAGGAVAVPTYTIDRMHVSVESGDRQGPPLVLADIAGTMHFTTYAGTPPAVAQRTDPTAFEQTLELELDVAHGRYLIVGARGTALPGLGTAQSATGAAQAPLTAASFGGVQLKDVAAQVGIDFRQGAFRFQADPTDPAAMMGGGVCWLDYDHDGWMDLFAVNSYSEREQDEWQRRGGLPRSALFHNVHGRFVDVSSTSGANVALRGTGCVAADFNGDGHTDLYVTAASGGALLWNTGHGTFTEGSVAAGLPQYDWHSGAAVSDVNGDGRPDLFIAGYASPNVPLDGSAGGFPSNVMGVRDLLYLNEGPDTHGHSRFREVGVQAGLESKTLAHGLGAVFTDVNGDGRPDLYVANDTDPNQLYVNVPVPGGAKTDPAGLGFRFVDRARKLGVADAGAGMGIAAADYSLDGHADVVVTNSHLQLHAVYRSNPTEQGAPGFRDARIDFVSAFDTSLAGWGVSWIDLDNDGNLDLAIANGAIPVLHPKRDVERIQVLENLAATGRPGQFADAGALVGLSTTRRVIGRGLAAADYDNDGRVDIAVNTIGGHLVLLHNTGADGHWLEVGTSVFAPGAVITAVLPNGRRLVREVQAGSSYLSSEDPRAHFGLGKATTVSVLTVRFPNGTERRLDNVAADRIITVAPSG